MTGPVLVLVGPPGAGKTTVGLLVADSLGVAFRDTDADVEAVSGSTVAELFVVEGEAYFRALEREAAARALAEHDGVLALGGGAVLDAGTRAAVRSATVIYLRVGIADAARRVGLGRDRPVLLGNPRATLRRLLEAREPLYAEVASATVSTDGRTPQEVAADVLGVLGSLTGRVR
jgi:shikimate kinase